MSLKADQTVVLIATLHDTIHSMAEQRVIGKVDVQRTLDSMKGNVDYVLRFWPGIQNRDWIYSKREKVNKYITDLNKEHYPTAALVRMAEMLVFDLLSEHTGTKKQLLQGFLPGLRVLVNHVDADDTNIPAMDEANDVLVGIYGIISEGKKGLDFL